MTRWLLAAVVLALVTCKGSGCLPGDYITTCHEACGEAGVAVVLPNRDVCVCASAPRVAP